MRKLSCPLGPLPLPGVEGVRRAAGAGAGDLAGSGGRRVPSTEPGPEPPALHTPWAERGGRANGRPPGATPRGAIRPPRSGPGPARRALHFLGAF